MKDPHRHDLCCRTLVRVKAETGDQDRMRIAGMVKQGDAYNDHGGFFGDGDEVRNAPSRQS